MNAKNIKELILDMDFKDLFEKFDLYSNRQEIVTIFCEQIKCNEEDFQIYLNDFNEVKAKPYEFRQACVKYINRLISDTNYPELQKIARILS